MTRLRQILYEMRQQPLICGVTFVATALSVFLFMIVAITQRVSTIPFPPESCRDRLLVGKFFHMRSLNSEGEGSAGLSYWTARDIYEGLDGVERISLTSTWLEEAPVKGTENVSFQTQQRRVDADFFRIFDHELVAGRYFTPAEVNSDMKVAVITESTARKAFGTTDCIGKSISINHKKHTVTGVVRDNSFLATNASGDVFTPFAPPERPDPSGDVWNVYFGQASVAILVKEGVDFGHIRNQVKARYAELATRLKPLGWEPIYHEQPYDQQVLSQGLIGSNITPEPSGNHLRYIFYAILLIVPAINLSSLLHSRMQRRVSEIGVRRAYGCTRLQIMTGIISENFLVTLAGGLAGLILGIIFALNYNNLYATMENYGQALIPNLSAVINWGTILTAIGVCFILNIISASIPAWQASRLNPVEAINKK